MKYCIVTFGCRVNQADSLVIERDLRARGGIEADAAEADVLIVNTCSVTAAADQGARQTIRRIVRGNPDIQVIVTGCYATRRPDELAALPNVISIIPNDHKDVMGSGVITTFERYGPGDGPCGDLTPGASGRTAFTLRVQTGCQEACSYCIIPTTRGASRSKPIATVMDDVRRAIAAGYKEIAITGVHLGAYGRDLAQPETLAGLLTRLSAVEEDVLFRVSSLEPMDCTPEIVGRVASSPRLAPHFHLPLQHGSDAMLRAMRRPYTAAQYRALIERIVDAMPNASIGSDVIVGFPGETDGHFRQLRSLLHDLPLSHLHVFPYSDRPGTEAAVMTHKVDGVAIRARGAEVRAIGAEMARRFRASQSGTIRRALTLDDGSSAVTDNYLKVKLDAPHARNEWIDVRIERAG